MVMRKKRVIITGADHPTGLGSARALYSQELYILGLCVNPSHSSCRSRVWNEIVKVDKDPQSYLEVLIKLGETYSEKSFLLPSQDSIVLLISENREVLGKYYEFVLPETSMVNMLMDKTSFHCWALDHGFPVPESHVASTKLEFDDILRDIRFPVIVKPLYRTKKWELLSPSNKVYMLLRKEEVNRIGFDLFEAAPRFLVQRWIPGSDSDVYFCLFYYNREGMEIGYYTGRKLLQWFVGTGSTSICVGTENHEVHRLASEIFRSASFKGLGSVEFKKSTEDGQYYVTEPTVGRNNLQSYVAVSGGVNLTRAAFLDAHRNNPMSVSVLPKGTRSVFIVEFNTLRSLLYLIRKRRLRLGELIKGLRGKGKISFAWFQMRDPLPFFHSIANMTGKMIKKVWELKINTPR